MAQAKKKIATKTAVKRSSAKRCTGSKKRICYKKYDRNQKSNMVFVISMSFLAATLLFANLLLMTS